MNAIGPIEGPRALDGIGCAQVAPMLCREIKERQYRILVLGQTRRPLLVFHAIFLFENVQAELAPARVAAC